MKFNFESIFGWFLVISGGVIGTLGLFNLLTNRLEQRQSLTILGMGLFIMITGIIIASSSKTGNKQPKNHPSSARSKQSDYLFFRFILAPVVVSIILGGLGFLITGKFTIGEGGFALIGLIITIAIGSKS